VIIMTRTTALLCTLLLPITACKDTATQKADSPNSSPSVEPQADRDAAPAAGAPEGYTAHLADALTQQRSGAAIATASAPPYGCGVKYADAGEPATAKLGEAAPMFSLPDLDGNTVSLADFVGKTVVLEWFNPDCPFVVYAHGEGPVAGRASEQGEAGVVWLAINSGAPGKQGHGADRNREAKAEWNMDHAILLDEDGKVGHAYGATSTPHMFVIDPAGKLVYAGGLDNAPLGRVEG
jgi:peroxiredoxin